MGAPASARNASTSDENDPSNYATFEEFVAASTQSSTMYSLAQRWNAVHPDEPVRPNVQFLASPPAPSPPTLAQSCNVTRALAAIQLIGGGLEVIVAGGALLAPEPTGATKVIGTVVLLHGVDTLQASVRTLLSCDRTATVTQVGATSVARFAGASPRTAQTIGIVTDVGIGAGGSLAVGTLSRLAPASQLVHLTSADSAAAIRVSQTLGLGRTIYAGPKSLANARGWSILARTGLHPKDATDVILLPSRANSAFLLVQPIGPFSAWQRLSGTVFSAGAGTVNLATGSFTRTGPAVNQIVVYGFDSLIMATARSAPAAIAPAAKP
ncbi:MAG TPA: hypothetical protein VJR89_14785 [Polyangiales bacterium]|nr:hypothetical protein [Polyangiales bacterium]